MQHAMKAGLRMSVGERAFAVLAGVVGWLAAIALLAALFGAGEADAADAVEPAAASSTVPAASAAAAKAAPVAVAVKPASRSQRLQITDPFIELRTGPGRGFPVFFVAPRDETIEIELRHTDWYRVRTENGKVGWVERVQLESTLTASGVKKSFRDILLDDYLSRRVQLGAGYGRFKSEPVLKLWTSYRLSETLSLEGTIGQVQGVFSGTDFWHLNVLAEPWSDRRFSPFASIGVGKFTNFPNSSLIGATTTDAKLANASVGARFYLSERFVLRGDYTLYTAFVSDAKTTEYHAFTAGISFFF